MTNAKENGLMRFRLLLTICGVLLLALLLVELSFRMLLGTPTLSIEHPTIEYMFAPNQDNTRFGNHIFINEYGMRSPAISANKKTSALRILVMGDSVLNGGNHTDQDDLATSIVERELNQSSSEGTFEVMNVSAGSWGPPNLLAYLKSKGHFQSDLAIVVLNTADHADAPSFSKLNPLTHPTKKPLSSSQEAWERYFPVLLRHFKKRSPIAGPTPKGEDRKAALSALSDLFDYFHEHNIPTMLLLHASRKEFVKGRYDHEADFLKSLATSADVEFVEDMSALRQSKASGTGVFRDAIHPNAEGQKVLASLLLKYLYSTSALQEGFKTKKALN